MTAVEDELQVATHGEHAGAPPPFRFQLVEVVGLEVEAIDANETDEGQNHRLMTEAQLGPWMIETDTAVGIGYQLAQQITLTIGLASAIEFAGTVLDIPEGIVNLPHVIR